MMRRLCIARGMITTAVAVAAAGCGRDVPEAPTWQAHVKPILEANCVRCHGYPAIGGAPPSFRLDRFDTSFVDGETVRGASSMAEFIAARVGDGSMPPRLALDDDQVEVLTRWSQLDEAARSGARPGNQPPTITVTEVSRDGDLIVLAYDVDDPDRELVTGTLRFGTGPDEVVPGELHAGRGTLVLDTRAIPAGTIELVADLDDGGDRVSRDAGRLAISHGPGGVAPKVVVRAPGGHQLFTDGDETSQVAITYEVSDLDAGDILTVDVIAVDVTDPTRTVEIVADLELPTNPSTFTNNWDVATEPAGRWRVEVTASDGDHTATAASRPFTISHTSTEETFFTVADIRGKCTACHGSDAGRIPGLVDNDLTDPDTYNGDPADPDNPRGKKGLIYDRVVVRQDMPPVSSVLVEGSGDLTTEERARFAEWLLAGAPL